MSDTVNEVMYGKISTLTDTFRYSAQPVIVRENVAEHSFWTAMIAVGIAYEVEHSMVEKVALKALLHDIEECMTGDLVRDMKYASEDVREAIRKIEWQFTADLMTGLGEIGQRMFKVWQTSKDHTLTGQIVALADALSVISYCTKERLLGNTNLEEIRESCCRLIVNKFEDDVELFHIAESAIVESYRRWPNARS